jgi:hypothetical protein
MMNYVESHKESNDELDLIHKCNTDAQHEDSMKNQL